MKKLISLILILALALSASAALAKTVLPDQDEFEGLAGMVVNATVGEYNETDGTFAVLLYTDDCFDIEDIEKLAAGDTLLAGGQVYTVKEKTEEEDTGDILVTTEDGTEIVFTQVGDDDMIAMHKQGRQRTICNHAINCRQVLRCCIFPRPKASCLRTPQTRKTRKPWSPGAWRIS